MPTFRTDITADRSQFDAEMDAAAQKMLTTGQAMQSSMRVASLDIKTSLAGITLALGALGAGAVATFTSFVKSGIAAGASLHDLNLQTGLSVELLSALRPVAKQAGMEIATAAAMINKLEQNMLTFAQSGGGKGADAFRQLGYSQEQALAGLQNMDTFLPEFAKRLVETGVGGEQAGLAMQLMGKSGAAALPFLKQLAEEQKLMGTLTREQAAAADEFEDSMVTLGHETEKLKISLANALLPALNKITQAMVEARKANEGFWVSLFEGSKVAMQEAMGWNLAGDIARKTKELDEQYAYLRAVQSGATKANMQPYTQQEIDAIKDKITALIMERTALMDAAAAQKALREPDKPAKPLRELPVVDNTPEKSRMGEWEVQLAAWRNAYDQEKILQGSFEQWSKQMDADYWGVLLDNEQLSDTERQAIETKYFALLRELRKEDFEGDIAGIKAQIEAQKAGANERIRLADEIYQRIRLRYGEESKEAQHALAEVGKTVRENADQARKLNEIAIDGDAQASTNRIALAREENEQLARLGIISEKERLERSRALIAEEFAAERQREAEKAAQYASDEQQYAEHMKRIAEINGKEVLALKKLGNQITVEGFKPWRTLFDSITSGFSSAIRGVIQGTQTLGQAVRNILQTVVLSVVDMGIKMLAQWALNAIVGAAIERASALGKIGASAAVAAAATFASISAIPVIGPGMAPEAAAAAYKATLAWGFAIPAAAKGYDIPAGVNPLTQLHQREMVLPEAESDVIRNLAARGGGGEPQINLYVNAVDARGVKRLLLDNRWAVAAALKAAHRDGAFVGS